LTNGATVYAHGAKGVLQYYQELTGFSDVKTIKVILKSILQNPLKTTGLSGLRRPLYPVMTTTV
jgi:hypothetical protein